MARAERRLPARLRITRPEQSMPVRTRMLGIAAAVALGLLALAAAGVGKRAGRSDSLEAAPSLPQLRTQPAKRPGELGDYAIIGQAPVFYADRQPHPFVIPAAGGEGQPAAATFDFVLTGVILSPASQIATLQPKAGGEAVRVLKGEAPKGAEGWVLQTVEPRAAVFTGPGGESRLELRTFTSGGGVSMPGMPPPPPQPPSPSMPQDAEQAAAAARAAAMEAAQNMPPTPEAVPSDAQIQAIRARIQARRAELARQRATGQNQNP